MTDVIAPFLAATIRTAVPLALAAMGELLVERAGLINIGLEGAILAGAFGALVGASAGGVAAGFVAALVAGLLVGALFALCVIVMRADQIIAGTALTLLSVGATGTLYRTLFGSSGAALGIPTSAPFSIPGLSALPVVGAALFSQPPITYLAYLLGPVLAWWLSRTHAGLALRAVGERPEAAEAAGINVDRMRTAAILTGGALGGIAGGTLVLAQAGTFAEGMSAGRGFIAIAIVVLGRWTPLGVAGGALLFGAASALQFAFQAMGWRAPYQLFLVAPYLLTLTALAGAVGRARAPAALGKALEPRR
ncbi:MAG TPA: ABC transporter permease [Gemmatimonadaceae bacterium]|jgi:simple sugar transport system permease protein|nr:ABC transporter permease [Gemmatimonadaceae bacterium]